MTHYLRIKALGLLVLISFWNLTLLAQLNPTQSTAANAVSTLTGSGINATNISLSRGHSRQLGTFTNSPNPPAPTIGILNGIVLSTGSAEETGPANNDATESISNSDDGEPDLSILINSPQTPLHDVVALEFDFVPSESVINFKFCFGTEESLAECNNGFADIMGFFLSGPGIAGGQGFVNDAINLAVIPGTSTPVGICTINQNTNSQYYNTNSYWNYAGNQANFEFDRFTDVFQASYNNLTCGETYHIKLVIADAKDRLKDSGVFIEAGSFSSPTDVIGLEHPFEACEGELVTLSVNDANPANTYVWSTGATTNSITEIARLDADQFSVTVTTPSGCQKVYTSSIIVHPLADTPPYTTGYNNTNQFSVVINANSTVSGQIFGLDDDIYDLVTMTWNNGLPGGVMTITGNNTQNPVGSLVWTPTTSQIGDHTFTVTTTGTDLCGSSSNTDIYHVRVICEFCPVTIFLEDRTANTTPLQSYTEAGGSVIAGNSVTPLLMDGPVDITGTTGTTEFAAGMEIGLKPGFSAKATQTRDFNAQIGEICLEAGDCNNCCDEWPGFSHGSLPNIFTPNGDGQNDFWELTDHANPFCAYGATMFTIKVFNRFGTIVFQKTEIGQGCCPFISPTNGLSSIHWDGKNNQGNQVPDGQYIIVVELFGCGNSKELNSGFVTLLGSNKRDVSNGTEEFLGFGENELSVYPNPVLGGTTLSFEHGLDEEAPVELLDETGKMIQTWVIPAGDKSIQLDLSPYASGSYFIRVIAPDQTAEIKAVMKR